MMNTHRHTGAPDSAGLPRTSGCPDVVEALEDAVAACPEPGRAPASNPWHPLFYEGLRDRALPALIADDTITPAASLWTGSRLWTEAFRASDLQPGDRVVLALPYSAPFVQVLVAAMWEGYTVVPCPPDADVDAVLDAVDARAVVTSYSFVHSWVPEGCAGPRSTPDALRDTSSPPTPDVRFLLRTSGTTGLARWVALSDRNVLSVLASHLPHFELSNARCLSVLPWSHCFGLVLDLFPALLAGAEIIRDPDGGRDPNRLTALSDAWGSTHLNAVPLTVQRLLDHSAGPRLLDRLHGGIVGGAPISAPLARALSDTRLRVGYGQTEASPGITLGAPGEWDANFLGRPVGCSVSVAPDGELLYQGPNACTGFWRDGTLHRADPDRTVHSGDLVRQEGDCLYFQGRKDDAFKLSNGRLVHASHWEAKLKDRFDALHDAFLFSPDGDRLVVALRLPPDTDAPDADAVRDVLGPLAARLDWITTVAPEAWSASAKGTVDRHAMSHKLSDAWASDTTSSPVRPS